MKQKLFALNDENLVEINKLLEEGYQLGNQYLAGAGSVVYITLIKYPPPVYNQGHGFTVPYNGGF